MTFQELDRSEALKVALEDNSHGVAVYFKHSTRCSISRMVESRLLNSKIVLDGVPCYLIEVVKSREVSNLLAELSGVKHESPQIIILERRKCVQSWSHNAITPEDIQEAVRRLASAQG